MLGHSLFSWAYDKISPNQLIIALNFRVPQSLQHLTAKIGVKGLIPSSLPSSDNFMGQITLGLDEFMHI